MKKIMMTLMILSVCNTVAFKPRKKLKQMTVSKVGQGGNLVINVDIAMPGGQKLNKGAGSFLRVYEKTGQQSWHLVQKINLNDRELIPGMASKVTSHLNLLSKDSEIALDATVYHCSIEKGKGPCYIDHFQRVMKRSEGEAKDLSVNLIPTKEVI